MKIIYLGSPYTHPIKSIMQVRYNLTLEAQAYILRLGLACINPIGLHHPVAERFDLPRGWEFWEKVDCALLDACDELWVLKLDGWELSKGVRAEIDMMKYLCKPIKHYTMVELSHLTK
jgi:hypothetical protein